jgi:hypothetical protein
MSPGAKSYRVCNQCGVKRQIAWHHRLDEAHQAANYICKWCKPVKVRNGAHGCADPEYQRDWHLAKRYGISSVEYDAMLEEQCGVCAICGKPPKKNRLHVDHDHDTGRIRGLLCVACNSKLEWMLTYGEKATQYLLDPSDFEASQYIPGLIDVIPKETT